MLDLNFTKNVRFFFKFCWFPIGRQSWLMWGYFILHLIAGRPKYVFHNKWYCDMFKVNTVKPVTRGHLNFEIGMSKLHFLWTKIYFNIEMYLWRGDTCHVGTLFEVSPRHRFHCSSKYFAGLILYGRHILGEMRGRKPTLPGKLTLGKTPASYLQFVWSWVSPMLQTMQNSCRPSVIWSQTCKQTNRN